MQTGQILVAQQQMKDQLLKLEMDLFQDEL
jgi:hypothetical protein